MPLNFEIDFKDVIDGCGEIRVQLQHDYLYSFYLNTVNKLVTFVYRAEVRAFYAIEDDGHVSKDLPPVSFNAYAHDRQRMRLVYCHGHRKGIEYNLDNHLWNYPIWSNGEIWLTAPKNV
ncbi:MAG: hypothetical protein LPH21_18465 [Shewanella sp.]|nr:hypothetical protein [Shewanella sp.]